MEKAWESITLNTILSHGHTSVTDDRTCHYLVHLVSISNLLFYCFLLLMVEQDFALLEWSLWWCSVIWEAGADWYIISTDQTVSDILTKMSWFGYLSALYPALFCIPWGSSFQCICHSLEAQERPHRFPTLSFFHRLSVFHMRWGWSHILWWVFAWFSLSWIESHSI